MKENLFKKALLEPDIFTVTWELVPGRGAREAAQDNVLALARQAAAGKKIHALSLTDNPGGTPAMSADFMGIEILNIGIEPLVHFTCKDKNRSALESQLYALDRAGVRNLLVMSGDYPVAGFQGRPAPVFDFDPVHALELISAMNKGLESPGPKGVIRQKPGDFFAGAVVSPFKATEAEQMAQYYKLKKKIAVGAQFIATQLGYDVRKIHEVFLFMKQSGFNVPIVGNVYILPYGAARMMNNNELPGSVVTHKLLAELDRERSDPDKGEGARMLRAARMYAIMKGMGYNGVHIGGHNIKYEQVENIVSQGEALVSQWQDLVRYFDYPIPDGFYYFERDPATKVVALFGEIGSTQEERVADLIESGRFTKPLVAYIGGKAAKSGTRFSHAGAIIEGGKGTHASKVERLRAAGAVVVDAIAEIPVRVGEILKGLT